MSDRLRAVFETDCDVYYVFNGTAANSLALASICQSYQSVICSSIAHIENDECGAPGFFSNGAKLLVAESQSPSAQLGKLSPEALHQVATKRTDLHYTKPRAVSITQATELGTVYSVDEVSALSEVAKRNGLKLHMDGARFANAVAHLGCSAADITWKAGVDVLCFGGTKNGLPVGEAVVFFDRELSKDFAWRAKQAGQLASKMRHISAPWVGLLENDVWLRNARHANAMAQRLYQGLLKIPSVKVMHPPQANGVFVTLPAGVADELRKEFRFYDWNAATGEVRWMCAWDTTEDDIDYFASAVKKVLEGK